MILLPCNKTITAEQVAKLLLENLYKWFGLPDKFISDRGPQFAAHAFRELLKLLGITSKLSTAYHPQTNGATEWVNQEIEAYLSIFCSSFPEEWAKKLYLVEFTHNNWQHTERKQPPFELMHGESPKTVPITFEKTKYPLIEQQMHNWIQDREEALAAHELAMRRIADEWKNTFIPFKKGDKVWLDMRNIKTTNNPKIGPQREGPFKISDILEPLTYWLNLPTSWQIHNIFHAVLLRPYIENKIHGANFPWPPPELFEGEEVYEVESILKHRQRGRGYQYLIKWKGYLINDAMWEAKTAFSDDGNMLVAYKDQHQLWTTMSYPYPYHLLPYKTYKEWFNADMKSLIHNVWGLQNNLLWLELYYATPYLDWEHTLDYFLVDCILQVNNIRHKILDIRLALLCRDKLSTLLQLG